jgi:hypothetical protein
MTNFPNTLAAIVQDFVISLSAERKAELKYVLLNPQFSKRGIIHMSDPKNTLAAVVDDFVASLSVERASELKNLLLSYQTTDSRPWYKEILSRYLIGPNTEALIKDIETYYPDGEFVNGVEATRGVPIYEAEMILQEAKKVLNK